MQVLPMKNGGRIISIGSAVGDRVQTPGLVAYSATKGAVKIFTQGLSSEVGGRGITVNNIQPGPIDTDLNHLKSNRRRTGRPVTRKTARSTTKLHKKENLNVRNSSDG